MGAGKIIKDVEEKKFWRRTWDIFRYEKKEEEVTKLRKNN